MLSERAQRSEALPISWLMQQAVEVDGLISLAAGLVDRISLPQQRVQEIVSDILSDANAARDALQYGTTMGLRPLREAVIERYLPGGAYADPDRVVITSGSQQFLELTAEALYDPGDLVIVEEPTYFVYTGVLSSLGVETLGVPTDADGMIIDALVERLNTLSDAQRKKLKAIYIVSYSQNPNGRTLSSTRREQLAALLPQLPPEVVVIEDAAYYELRFDLASRPPLLASLDPTGERVITALTTSKPFAPGFKTGFGIVPRGPWRDTIENLKGNHDFGSSNFAQHVVYRAIASGAFDEQAAEFRERYQHKAQILAAALREHFSPEECDWHAPDGGLYLWARFPGIDTGREGAFLRSCLDHGVLYVPGSYAYNSDDAPRDRARLTYGVADDPDLIEGAARLARAYADIKPANTAR